MISSIHASRQLFHRCVLGADSSLSLAANDAVQAERATRLRASGSQPIIAVRARSARSGAAGATLSTEDP
jgi:hypothetical protein